LEIAIDHKVLTECGNGKHRRRDQQSQLHFIAKYQNKSDGAENKVSQK